MITERSDNFRAVAAYTVTAKALNAKTKKSVCLRTKPNKTASSLRRLTSEVTHNHPEGIKGAEATARVISLARKGSTKDEIRDCIVQEFGYDLPRTCDEIPKL